MEYYCEIFPYSDDPYFSGYKCEAQTDEDAMNYFRSKHGEALIFVYDENFRTVFESDKEP